MKKFAAIFSLSLLLFIAAGYRLLINMLENHAQENLQAVIKEKTYDPTHLIELSVHIDLPYLSDWDNWEAVQGMITIDGIPYQYVERILKGGKMTYRCLPNAGVQQALSARDRFMQLSYELTQTAGKPAKSGSVPTVKPPVLDIICLEFAGSLNLCLQALPGQVALEPFATLPSLAIPVLTPPPQKA